MNNKILAFVLSIVAVVVVIYQIFLREDDSNIKKNKTARFVKSNTNNNRPAPRPAAIDNSAANKNNSESIDDSSNRMIIDIYSPGLLKRVDPYIESPKIEISGAIGENFFKYQKTKKVEATESKKEFIRPLLTLNGIIELIKDNITIAIINNRLYRKGESIDNAVVTKIEKNKVFLKLNEETIILTVNQGSYKGWIKKKIGGNS